MTNYVINRTDPANGSFSVLPNTIDGTDLPWSPAFYNNAASGLQATSKNSSLVFAGQAIVEYGELVQNNLMYLMEHFAYRSRPLTPTQGQIWYKNANFADPAYPSDPTSQGLYVFNGSSWSPILTAVSGNIDMGGARIINLGNATTDTDALNRITADDRYLRLSGGTVTGSVTFSSGTITVSSGSFTAAAGVPVTITDAPSTGLHATNKNYVDAADTILANGLATETNDRVQADTALNDSISAITLLLPGYLQTAGDTMEGPLTFNANSSITAVPGGTGTFSFGSKRLQQIADPTTNTDAATKFYVDTEISAAIGALPPAAASDGVVFAGTFNTATGVLTLQRTLGLPDVTVTGTMAPFVHSHVSSAVTYDLSLLYSESTLVTSLIGTSGYPVVPVYNAIQQLDVLATRLSRPIERRMFAGNDSTATFNLGNAEYRVEENRLQVFVDGVKYYANERGYSMIEFSANPISPRSVTGLSGAYTFNVTANGGSSTPVVIVATAPYTYLQLAQGLQSAFTTLSLPLRVSYVLHFDRLEMYIYSTTTGTGSNVTVSYGVGELFQSIATSSAPVNVAVTRTLGYAETGFPGGVSSTFTFTTPPASGTVIEALVFPA